MTVTLTIPELLGALGEELPGLVQRVHHDDLVPEGNGMYHYDMPVVAEKLKENMTRLVALIGQNQLNGGLLRDIVASASLCYGVVILMEQRLGDSDEKEG